MKSWAWGAMILTVFALGACKKSSSTGTGTTSTSSGAGGNTSGTGGGSSSAGGATGTGGASTGTQTTSTGTNTTGTNTTGTNTTGSNTTSTSSFTGGTGGAGGGGVDCSTDANCPMCCQDNNPDATNALLSYIIDDCACANAQALCHSTCAPSEPSFCTDPSVMPSQPCIDCIQGAIDNNNACVGMAAQSCAGDATCTPILDCFQTCQ